MVSKFKNSRDSHVHLEGSLVIPNSLRTKMTMPEISWPPPGPAAVNTFLMAFALIRIEKATDKDITLVVKSSVEFLPKWLDFTGADLRIAFRFWASLLGKSDDPWCLHDAFHAVIQGVKKAILPPQFHLTLWASVSRRGGLRAVQSLSRILDELNATDHLEIVGIDLAGSEAYNAAPFLEYASAWKKKGGYLAMHAGETPYQPYSDENIAEAIEAGSNRIGHCLTKREDLWLEIANKDILIERCPLAYKKMLPPDYSSYLTVPQYAQRLLITGSDDPAFLL